MQYTHLSSSVKKYGSKQTSVSLMKNESGSHVYPSVTFCPMFKNGVLLTEQVLDQEMHNSCLHKCGKGEAAKKLLVTAVDIIDNCIGRV